MRFYLINFSYSNAYSEKTRNPPIGAGYILQHLEDHGVCCRYYEWSFQADLPRLLDEIRQFAPDLVGCSLMSYHYQESYSIIGRIAELGIPVVCGGAHVNSQGAPVLEEVNVDFLVKGEGESALLSLLRCLETDGGDFTGVPGLVYRKDGGIVENPAEQLRLDSLHFPKYAEFRLPSYSNEEMLLQSSRGCPYFCTYCQQSALLGKKWRCRTPAQIFEEMEYWAARGMTNFLLADDNLTLDRKRILELCRLIRTSRFRYDIQTAGVRVDNADQELLQTMRESRFNYLSFGIESGSDRVLKEIRKGITLSQIHRTLEMACGLGYKVKLYFIVNNRTETYDDVRASFALARQYPITLARFTNLVPYPHTYDYDWIVENGRLLVPPALFLNDPDRYVEEPLYEGPGMSLEERRMALAEARSEAARFEPKWADRIRAGVDLLRRGEYRTLFQEVASRLGGAWK